MDYYIIRKLEQEALYYSEAEISEAEAKDIDMAEDERFELLSEEKFEKVILKEFDAWSEEEAIKTFMESIYDEIIDDIHSIYDGVDIYDYQKRLGGYVNEASYYTADDLIEELPSWYRGPGIYAIWEDEDLENERLVDLTRKNIERFKILDCTYFVTDIRPKNVDY